MTWGKRAAALRWGLLLIGLAAMPAAAQEDASRAEKPETPAAEEEEEPIPAAEVLDIVTKVERAYEEAYGRKDTSWMASLYTETATIQTDKGTVYKGRGPIETMFEAGLASRREGETIRSEVTVSTAVTKDLIVSHGVTFRIVPETGAERFFYTRVYARKGDAWQIAASHVARAGGGIQIPLE